MIGQSVRRCLRVVLASVSVPALCSAIVFAESPNSATLRPFAPGERLTYTLSWGKIAAGTAVMEVAERQTFSGRSVLKLLHTARSNNFVSVFYPVNNRVESLLDEDGIYSQRLMFNRREGRRKNDIEIQDTLSVLYFFRTLPGTALQTSTTVDVHHDKKNYRLELRVEGTERMKTPLGEVDTVRILAIMPFKGLFMNEGNIRIWVTNDAARIPVFMKAKVIIGSVTAALTSVEGTTLGRP